MALLLIIGTAVTVVAGASTPAFASGEQAVVGMPFSGNWAYSNATSASCGPASNQTSHPSCHEIYFGDWSTDLYAPGGTNVKLQVTGINGSLSFAWDTNATGSCGATRRVMVYAGGVYVGRIHYAHLANAASTASAPTQGMTIGTIYNDPNNNCNPGGSGRHIHIEFDNQVNHSCYVNYSTSSHTAGVGVAAGDPIGVLGSSNTGTQQQCTSVPTNPASNEDADPSLAVGSAGTVYSLQVAKDGCGKIYSRPQGISTWSLYEQLPSTCEWSTGGSHDMVMVPGTDNEAWIAIIKDAGGGELYLYKMDSNGAHNVVEVGLGGWSINTPPALAILSDGSLSIAAVKQNGHLWAFHRSTSGVLTNEGEIGLGDWSTTGTVALAASPTGPAWMAATKANGDTWTFARGTAGNWTNEGSLGSGDWSAIARPAVTSDNDGDITVALVKEAGASGAAAYSFHRCVTCTAWSSASQIGGTSQWSDQGTLALQAAPDDRVWVAAVKQGSTNAAALWALVFTPNYSMANNGSWGSATELGSSSTDQWSPRSAPAITIASGGTVFVSKVQTTGGMKAQRRDASTGTWYSHGAIGGSGWSGD
jgi:hypothetical protein